jgi:DNA-binding response OmpR family regulator
MANILIADSYPAVGVLYREVLEEHGYQVFAASSGREALLVALHKTIDIAVVDDTLPDFSANEILTRLKHLQPHVQFILTVSSTFVAAATGERWDGLIRKSSDYTLLRDEIDRLAMLRHAPQRELPGSHTSGFLFPAGSGGQAPQE